METLAFLDQRFHRRQLASDTDCKAVDTLTAIAVVVGNHIRTLMDNVIRVHMLLMTHNLLAIHNFRMKMASRNLMMMLASGNNCVHTQLVDRRLASRMNIRIQMLASGTLHKLAFRTMMSTMLMYTLVDTSQLFE